MTKELLTFIFLGWLMTLTQVWYKEKLSNSQTETTTYSVSITCGRPPPSAVKSMRIRYKKRHRSA